MDRENQDQPQQSDQQRGEGRIQKTVSRDKDFIKSKDISFIDRQEGDMDNGELGGNFFDKEKKEGEGQVKE